MSRCAHDQSTYQLRKLPFCSRCKNQFVLVMSAYENLKGYFMEWECPKCHKVVPKELLREENIDGQDIYLNQKFGTPPTPNKQSTKKYKRNR